MLYLHLHEFLPAATARGLPWHVRAVITRNCGERAWDVLRRAMDWLDEDFTTCAALLDAAS